MGGNITLYKRTWTDPKTGEEREAAVWSYTIWFAGKRFRGSTKQRLKTLAQAFAEEELRRIERAYAGLPTDRPQNRIRTVAEAYQDYLAIYRANQRPRAVELVETRAKPILARLGGCLLSEIDERRVSDYIARRRKDGMSNRTINIETGLLARILGSTRRALWPKLRPLRENADAGRALTDEEVDRLLEGAARSASPYLRLAVLMALTTGMRRGEIETLTWGQVHFDRNELRVGRSKTAAGEGRVIPLNADLRAALELHAAWYARQFGSCRPEWYVFPFCRTKRPADPARPVTTLRTGWENLRRAVGVEARFHDLRHTAASRMGRAGVSRAAMMKVLGHASAALVDRYCHAEDRDLRAAVEALRLQTDRHRNRHSDDFTAECGSGKSLVLQ
jgi:integrase